MDLCQRRELSPPPVLAAVADRKPPPALAVLVRQTDVRELLSLPTHLFVRQPSSLIEFRFRAAWLLYKVSAVQLRALRRMDHASHSVIVKATSSLGCSCL